MRVRAIITICVASLVAGACSGAEDTGPQTGEVGGECFEGDICDPGLRCVSGYCVPNEGKTDTADGSSSDSSGPADGNQAPTVAGHNDFVPFDQGCMDDLAALEVSQ